MQTGVFKVQATVGLPKNLKLVFVFSAAMAVLMAFALTQSVSANHTILDQCAVFMIAICKISLVMVRQHVSVIMGNVLAVTFSFT